MAFFGLTALGPSRPLAVGRDRVQHVHVFSDDDWAAAWEWQRRRLKRSRQEAEEAGLPLVVLPAILETVYQGPVPAADAALVTTWVRRRAVEDEVGKAGSEEQPKEPALRKKVFLEAVRCVLIERAVVKSGGGRA